MPGTRKSGPHKSTLRTMGLFLKGLDQKQNKLLKHYLRTGTKGTGLLDGTITRFAPLGLDAAEARNARRKKPYSATFTEEQRAHIATQARDLVEMLYTDRSRGGKNRLIKWLIARTKPVQRKPVEQKLKAGNFKSAFDLGEMYLSALNEKNRNKLVDERILRGRASGMHYGKTMSLSHDWQKELYEIPTPMHEMAHLLVGENEYRALVIDFYYGLSRGIFSTEYLKKTVTEIDGDKRAMKKAIELNEIMRTVGKGQAEEELRKILFRGKKK